MSDTRALAHELVDSLPESQLRGLVEFLRAVVDPAAEALNAAPLDDEEQTQDEAQAVEEARRWLDEHDGKGIPHDEAMQRLGLA
jgi:hypothetical protein